MTEELLRVVTSVNVAGGAHGGDPPTLREWVRAAARAGVAVGVHPGYPDRAGLGRVSLDLAADDLLAHLLYQVGGVSLLAHEEGVRLAHLKPHGALYHDAARDPRVAEVVVRAARTAGHLPVVGPPVGALADAARAAGLVYWAEGFVDRGYRSDGTLVPRGQEGDVHASEEAARAQALSLARGWVLSVDGQRVSVRVDTLCVHADTPRALELARAARRALEDAGIPVQPLGGERAERDSGLR